MSRIVWLASYPKSGNTWLRAFLANLQSGRNQPIDVNDLRIGGILSDRRAADDALGVESCDLNCHELDRYRPAICRQIANSSDKTLYVKIHDAYTYNSEAEPVVPADVSSAAVYVVRNPLDVAVSFANHSGITLDESIERMSRETAWLAYRSDRLDPQLPQRLLSWSGHVLSWLNQSAIPLRIMRYEDMQHRPLEEFAKTARFIDLDVDMESVRRAAAFSSFMALREQELMHGFREKPYGAASFFRSGQVEDWRGKLTNEQVARVIRDHGPVMDRLGYLPVRGIS